MSCPTTTRVAEAKERRKGDGKGVQHAANPSEREGHGTVRRRPPATTDLGDIGTVDWNVREHSNRACCRWRAKMLVPVRKKGVVALFSVLRERTPLLPSLEILHSTDLEACNTQLRRKARWSSEPRRWFLPFGGVTPEKFSSSVR